MKRKLLASFVALMMVFSVMAVSAFAAEGDCQHENTTESTADATCNAAFTVTETCDDCGDVVNTYSVGEALGHDWKLDTSLEGYVAATCTETGVDTYECTRCEDTKTEETEALGHSLGEGEVVDASCEFGAGVKYVCTVCDAVVIEEFEGDLAVEAKGHDHEAVVTAPNCTEKGYTTYTCTVCGDSYKADETEAVPDAHVDVQSNVLKQPTCDTTGIAKFVCDICGANRGYKVIESEHDWNEIGRTEATCAEAGEIESLCSICGETKTEVIDATGEHDYEENYIDATCIAPAKVGQVCSVCGAEGDTEVVGGSEPLGHDMVLDTTAEGYVAATCAEAGVNTLKCSRCDYTETENTEALGHSWDNGVHADADCVNPSGALYTCEVCGETMRESYGFDEAKGHSYESVVTEPTCKDGGYTTHTCSACGDEFVDGETDAVTDAHVSALTTVLKEATCTTNGIGKYECEICGTGLGYKTIIAKHDWTETGRTEPTCAEEGKIEYLCSICGQTKIEDFDEDVDHDYEENYIDATCDAPAQVGQVCSVCGVAGETTVVEGSVALGHDMVLDTTAENYVAATCTEGGVDTLKCSRCDRTEENVTKALEHEYNEGEHTEATCENASGVKYTCSVCGEIYVEAYPEGIVTPALGHSYESVVTKPTCKDGGYTTYTCSVCGDEYVADETDVNADAHVSALTTVLKEATCTTNGIGKYECEICGNGLGYKTIEAKHDWTETGRTEATCAEAGEIEYLCSICGETEYDEIPATGDHDYEENYIDATCTEPAKVGEVCSVCGAAGETTDVEGSVALGHDMVLDTTAEGYVAATCEEGGIDTLKCSRCNYTENKDTDAKGHEYDEGVHADADCVNPSGVKSTCAICGEIKVDVYPPEVGTAALGHNYESVVTAPTCKDGGYTTHTCSVCGDEYVDDETAATPNEHVSVLTTVLKEATCTTTGIGKYACEICGTSQGYKTIEAKHDWNETGRTEATCAEAGEIEYLCSICGDTKTEVIDATGKHDYEENYIDATCTEPAKVGQVCSVCGAEGDTEVVDGSVALDHDMVLDTTDENYVAATCEEGGKDTLKCSRCDYTETEDTEALRHSWDNGVHADADCENASGVKFTCAICGEIKVDVYPPEVGTDALGHNYESVVTAPTCKDGGYTTYTCSACGDEYVADETDVNADAHKAVEVAVLREPTCEVAGISKFECELCGKNLGYQSVDSGHDWNETGRTDATCAEAGEIEYLCSICGETYTEEIAATGEHDYEENYIDATCTEPAKVGQVCSVCGAEGITEEVEGSVALDHDLVLDTTDDGYVAATCEEGGVDTLKCSRCDYTETEATKATGHDYDDGIHVDATCTKDAHVEQTCANCGAVIVIEYEEGVGEKALGHDEQYEVIEATCVAGGYTNVTCSRCDLAEVVEETEADPDAHELTIQVIKPATCAATGINKEICNLCDYSAYKASDVLDHTYDEEAEQITKEATCMEEGVISNSCTVCGTTVQVGTIPTTDHAEIVVEGTPATCTEGGMTDGVACDDCGEVIVAQTEIGALGHDMITDAAVAATCTETGLTEGSHCDRCGLVDVAQTETPALGHTEVTDAAVDETCTESGLTEGSHCDVCAEILVAQEIIYAPGHDVVVDEAVEATCTESGLTEGSHCDVCGEILVAQEEIPAGHSYDYDTIVDYGEDDIGPYVVYACGVCGDQYKDYGF